MNSSGGGGTPTRVPWIRHCRPNSKLKSSIKAIVKNSSTWIDTKLYLYMKIPEILMNNIILIISCNN